jgi:hypothetical protein
MRQGNVGLRGAVLVAAAAEANPKAFLECFFGRLVVAAEEVQLAEVVERLCDPSPIPEVAFEGRALLKGGDRRFPLLLIHVHDADVVEALCEAAQIAGALFVRRHPLVLGKRFRTAIEVFECDRPMAANLDDQPSRRFRRRRNFQRALVEAKGQTVKTTASRNDAALIEHQRTDVWRLALRCRPGALCEFRGCAKVASFFFHGHRLCDEDWCRGTGCRQPGREAEGARFHERIDQRDH